MRRSLSLIWTSTSSASGSTATVAVEVWMRPLASVAGHALHAVHAAFVFQLAVHAAAFDRRDHFLEAADAGVAARHHLERASRCARRTSLYIRNSSPAKSAASSPPVPARISSTTFFSSFGSFGMSRIFELGEERVAPGDERTSAPPARDRACRRRRQIASSSAPRGRARPPCIRGSARRAARARPAPSRACGTRTDRSAPRSCRASASAPRTAVLPPRACRS